MNKKLKLATGVVGLIGLVVLASFAYQTLSKQYRPEVQLQMAVSSTSSTQGQTESNTAGESGEEDKKVPAPDFTAVDANGKEVNLSDYIGKPIVLNFWASWCPPCKSEMPHFDEIYNDRKDDILFLMVDMVDGQRETKEKGEEFIRKQGFDFPVLYDKEQSAAYTYGVYSLPTTYFIDKQGNIVAGVEGAIDKETLLKGVELIKP